MKNQILEKAILKRVNKKFRESMTTDELFEITRGVWVVGVRREKAEYAFSVFKGVVQEVYEISNWYPAGTLKYKTREKSDVEKKGRWEFDGSLADQNIREKYVGLDLKDYFPQHASNPITHVNC